MSDNRAYSFSVDQNLTLGHSTRYHKIQTYNILTEQVDGAAVSQSRENYCPRNFSKNPILPKFNKRGSVVNLFHIFITSEFILETFVICQFQRKQMLWYFCSL